MKYSAFFAALLIPFSVGALLASPAITESEANAELRQLRERKFATGMINAEINGKKAEFMTTSETIHISDERIEAADPAARGFLKKMNGKTVHTAALREVGGFIHVGVDAYGNIEKTGPNTSGAKATSLKLSFALNPEGLKLEDGQRELRYTAPGSSDQSVANQVELSLDSIVKYPDGALGFKGSFSASLTSDELGKELKKAIPVKGTFDIQRASSSSVISSLMKGAK